MTGKRLLLMRHAKAAREGLKDFDRPLAPKGWAQTEAMAGILTARGLLPDLVLCSPARRARETLEGLGAALSGVKATFEPRLYGADSSTLLDVLAAEDGEAETILLIAHNPGIANLTLLLAAPDRIGSPPLDGSFPTGVIAHFSFACESWDGLRPRQGRLEERIFPPKS